MLSHFLITDKSISSILVVYQHDLESATLAWGVQTLHMHRSIIMSHNLVTERQKKLTHSKIDTQIAFQGDSSSPIGICLSIPPAMQKPSPLLCLNPIAIS